VALETGLELVIEPLSKMPRSCDVGDGDCRSQSRVSCSGKWESVPRVVDDDDGTAGIPSLVLVWSDRLGETSADGRDDSGMVWGTVVVLAVVFGGVESEGGDSWLGVFRVSGAPRSSDCPDVPGFSCLGGGMCPAPARDVILRLKKGMSSFGMK